MTDPRDGPLSAILYFIPVFRAIEGLETIV